MSNLQYLKAKEVREQSGEGGKVNMVLILSIVNDKGDKAVT